MSNMLSESTTIAEWAARMPTDAQLRKHQNGEMPERTDEEKLADVEWHIQLFEGTDTASICCLITYMVQVLKKRDIKATVYLLDSLKDLIEDEMLMAVLPPSVAAMVRLIQDMAE